MLKLIHGDCLEEVPKLSTKVGLVLSDPPYSKTKLEWDSVIDVKKMWEVLESITYDTTPVLLFGQQPFSSLLINSNLKNFKYDIVWDKCLATGFLNSKKRPLVKHENINIFYKKQCVYNHQFDKGDPYKKGYRKPCEGRQYNEYASVNVESLDGKRYPTSIVRLTNANKSNKAGHPTEKPVSILEYLIKTYSNEGDTVLDFCAGSFSTAVACINTNRNFIGIEKNMDYFKLGKDRILKHTEGLNIDVQY